MVCSRIGLDPESERGVHGMSFCSLFLCLKVVDEQINGCELTSVGL